MDFDVRRRGGAALLAAVATAVSWSQAEAAAWTQPKGGAEVIVSLRAQDSTHGFDAGGGAVDIVDYRKTELQAFAEYGLTDRLTLGLQGSVRRLRTANGRADEPGHIEVGVRYRLLARDGWVMSNQTSVRLPGGDADPGAAQKGSPDAEYDSRLLVGWSGTLGGREVFADVQGGLRRRDGDPPDERRFEATLGVRPRRQIMLMGQAYAVSSLGAGQGGYEAYRYLNLELSAVYALPAGWSAQAGLTGTASGRNALRERGAVVALWRRF
ncbi:hypothetical protein DMC25_21215 [Caulobacter sp. D4A]|uniref:hypothetical protein n=1 Tax=unclassified Caulobacter TaxID=2648921 RepID=UPI000D735266|nr:MULTISPECIES: hypothetical protein [unclassified Caulobacter]PXA80289.1 hypothetical protein DMC25_21215 [Caulobacter sp. D4A]PXA82629.1 hypothetical protein DMC18_25305 [Caulobacter sp. D5]